ncbi:heavy-metal-associated domain-containing protein [Micromonospora sp. NPDC050686]|uniref:heavy-metal-associated domain-containing protein n=1 Tax=Micromonospora sp. NPDC050686 TaxID=3154631 RepID=UPI0033FB90FF
MERGDLSGPEREDPSGTEHEDPSGTERQELSVPLPDGICRHCVRLISGRLRDLPGVVSLEYDAGRRVLRVGGQPDPAALRRAGFAACGEEGCQ